MLVSYFFSNVRMCACVCTRVCAFVGCVSVSVVNVCECMGGCGLPVHSGMWSGKVP